MTRASTRSRAAVAAARLIAVVGLLVLVSPAAAQPRTTSRFGQETHAFRRLIYDQKLEPLDSMSALMKDPAHTLFIVLGNADPVKELHLGFIQRGGSVLIATDHVGEAFPGYRVEGPLALADSFVQRSGYRGRFAECPIVQPDPDVDCPIFRNLERVVTNRPGYLDRRSSTLPDFAVLARFPEGCRSNSPWFLRSPIFAVGGNLGKGRVLLLSDHSVFINDMMLQPDNDNLDFAYNCLEWLDEGAERKTKVLLIEDGTVRSDPGDFSIPLKEVPTPDIVSWINQLLSDLEEEDIFSQILMEKLPAGVFMRLCAFLLTLGMLVYGWRRFGRARHRVEAGVPLLAKITAWQAGTGGVLEQRQQALLTAGNLWEAARALARQVFDSATATARAEPSAKKPPPLRIQVAGGWWRRWTLGRRVRRLWILAASPTPRRVSPREFRQLVVQLNEIKTALADGTLRLDATTR